ncbi:MAG TPA: hypothetical protein VHV27_07685 [Phenylobacterium sp.]|jgi:hypothetical protein|nr:hypothetical protein [Phenylobacterium sp.]
MLLLLAASSLALAGCKIDNRPLLARGDQPAVAALPDPGPIGANANVALVPVGQVVPNRAYPYAERAYALDRTFYDVPPDYGFDYGDEEPWVWETADDSYMFAEPYGDDYRFYYYQPGEDYPYFVRDADYGYAYGPDGSLIALFDAAGALLSAGDYDRYYPTARSYWSRGYDMHRDFGRAPRQTVNQGVWSQRAPTLARAQQSWLNAPARQPQWRQWRTSGGGQAVAQRLAAERPARMGARGGQFAPQMAAQGRGFERGRFGPAQTAPTAGGRNAGFQGGRFASMAPSGQAGARGADHNRFASLTPRGAPAMRAEAARGQAQHAARGEAQRFARQQQPAARAFAPSVQEHGRAAAFHAPAQIAGRAAFQARGGGGAAHVARAAPQGFATRGGGGGGGHQWHGGGGGGGQARMAQAAPQAFHGGGGGGQFHAPAAQQPHPGGGGQPHAQGGGGQPHGQGGGGHDKKHGG